MNDNPATETRDEHLATQPQRNGSGSGSERASDGRATPARGRNSTSFTTESAREAAQASARVRRENKLRREQRAHENATTVREKVGVALSKLSQHDWDETVRRATVNQRVALMNQAFGAPQPAEEDVPREGGLASLTREELAALLQMLEEGLNLDEPDAQPAEEQSPSARVRREMPSE